jgi:cell division protein FtsZ
VNLIFGAVIDPNMGEEIRITVIATGFDSQGMHPRLSRFPRPEQLKLNAEQERGSSVRRVQTHDDERLESVSIDLKDIDIPAFMRRKISMSNNSGNSNNK